MYASNGSDIVRVPKTGPDGSAPEVLATAQRFDIVTAIAVDETRVYWAEQTTLAATYLSYVFSAPLAGGPPVQLAAGDDRGMVDLVVDASHVYWSTREGIYSLPK